MLHKKDMIAGLGTEFYLSSVDAKFNHKSCPKEMRVTLDAKYDIEQYEVEWPTNFHCQSSWI